MKKSYQSLEVNSIYNMKQVIHRKLSFILLRLSLVVLIAFSSSLNAQEDAAAGKSLFNANCASCHKLNKKMTGPALANVETRLAEEEGLDREWLYAWIKNSAGWWSNNEISDDYIEKVIPYPTSRFSKYCRGVSFLGRMI